MFTKYGLVVAVGILAPTLALAEGGPMHGACMNDIKSVCGAIQPGGRTHSRLHEATSRAALHHLQGGDR